MSEHSQDCQMPQPTAEHGLLMEMVGTWNVDCSYFMGPGEPMRTQAQETIEPVGGFWTVSLFESLFMGAPFAGRATMGYDPQKGKWVGTWIDSMMPHMFVMEGDMDPETHVLTMHCEGPSMTGGTAPYRSVSTPLPDGRRQFDMYMTPPGSDEIRMFHYVYTRAE